MSHLVLRKVDGKWRMYNKKTDEFEGKAMEEYQEAKEKTQKQDVVEDKKLDENHDMIKKVAESQKTKKA